MALNTNGWDYIYNANITQLNALIKAEIDKKSNTAKGLVATKIKGTGIYESGGATTTKNIDRDNIIVEALSVKNSSNYPILDLEMTLGTDNNSLTPKPANAFTGLKFGITININWLNKGTTNNSTIAKNDNPLIFVKDIYLHTIPITSPASGLVGDELTAFMTVFQSYINDKEQQTGGVTLDSSVGRNYGKYYNFFASLNSFYTDTTNGLNWMEPTTQVFSVKKDVHQADSDTSCIFSFCCMINNKPNKDIGYVDINAIPALATSALVIERSVFGEYMVMPKIVNTFLTATNPSTDSTETWAGYKAKVKSNLATVANFTKNSAYSYVNNVELYLLSCDYNTKSGNKQNGKFSKKKVYINIEEDKLRLILTDVEYVYDNNNPKYDGSIKAQVSKEYIVNIALDTAATPPKLSSNVEEVYYTVNPVYPQTKEPDFWAAFKEVQHLGFGIGKAVTEVIFPFGFWLIKSKMENKRDQKITPLAKSQSPRNYSSLTSVNNSMMQQLNMVSPSLVEVNDVLPLYYNKILLSAFIDVFEDFLTEYCKTLNENQADLDGSEKQRILDFKFLQKIFFDKKKDIIEALIDSTSVYEEKEESHIIAISTFGIADSHSYKIIVRIRLAEEIGTNYYEFTYNDDTATLFYNINANRGEEFDTKIDLKYDKKFQIFKQIIGYLTKETKEVKELVTYYEKVQRKKIDDAVDKLESSIDSLKKLTKDDIDKMVTKVAQINADLNKENKWIKGLDRLGTGLSPFVTYGLDMGLNAVAYQSSVKEANSQIKLDTSIKEHRTKPTPTPTEATKFLIDNSIKENSDAIVLPKPTGSIFHNVQLDGAFRISYSNTIT